MKTISNGEERDERTDLQDPSARATAEVEVAINGVDEAIEQINRIKDAGVEANEIVQELKDKLEEMPEMNDLSAEELFEASED